MDTLQLHPGQDHLERVAKARDPLKGICELVWNSLDGDCTEVSVEFDQNVFGGLSNIRVRDNGTGMPPEALKREYGQLGESWKKDTRRTPKFARAMHGKEGRGRLRFFSLAGHARWTSIFEAGGELRSLVATINAASLGTTHISEPTALDEDGNDHATGTTVELSSLKDTFDWLTGQQAFLEFSAVFAPYVLQYPNVLIRYHGRDVVPSISIARQFDVPLPQILGTQQPITDLRLKIIEWNGQLGDRRIYFGADDGISLASQPAGVTAPGFSFTAYAYSSFFERMNEINLLELDDLTDPDLAKIVDVVRDGLRDYFRERQSQEASEVIEQLKAEGAYPYEGDAKSAVETREREVFNIATYAVSSYSREFKRADTSLKKLTLALLRETVRHNPDSVTNFLKAVINLPKNRQDEFSSLLDRTELSNIISASSLIADRVTSLQVIKEMVSDPERRLSVKERGELDQIVQANTWIFGEQFHMSLAETGLTRVMQRVAADLGMHRSSSSKVAKPNGGVGRADAFLGRVIPHPSHEHREYLLVELKRPRVIIGRKESDQLEDYARALISQPEFADTSTSWNFFLVATDIGDDLLHRVTQQDRPQGLYLDLDRAKVWIKRWGEVLRLAEARLQFIQDHLKVEVTDELIDARVAELKASILKKPEASELSHPREGA